jgi:hypothetical protein
MAEDGSGTSKDGKPELRIVPGQHGGPRPHSGRPRKKPGPAASKVKADAYEVLAKAKAEHEVYKAKIAALDYKRQSGEIILKSEAQTAWAEEIHRIKNHFLSIPSRVAPTVLALDELRDVERAIRDAILEALDGYSTSTD